MPDMDSISDKSGTLSRGGTKTVVCNLWVNCHSCKFKRQTRLLALSMSWPVGW
jgi:hypothetical protein